MCARALLPLPMVMDTLIRVSGTLASLAPANARGKYWSKRGKQTGPDLAGGEGAGEPRLGRRRNHGPFLRFFLSASRPLTGIETWS